MTRLVESSRKVELNVGWKNGMRNRPADDRKMPRPNPSWPRTTEAFGKLLELKPNKVSITMLRPSRGFFFERLPVLLALIPVAHFSCVYNKWKPPVGRGWSLPEHGTEKRLEVGDFGAVEAMFQHEDWLSPSMLISLLA
jgi:hypothetical protein